MVRKWKTMDSTLGDHCPFLHILCLFFLLYFFIHLFFLKNRPAAMTAIKISPSQAIFRLIELIIAHNCCCNNWYLQKLSSNTFLERRNKQNGYSDRPGTIFFYTFIFSKKPPIRSRLLLPAPQSWKQKNISHCHNIACN